MSTDTGITVNLYGTLRDKVPRQNKGKIVLEHTSGMQIKDIMSSLDISEHNLISIGETQEVEFSHEVNAGDVIHVFPPVSGG